MRHKIGDVMDFNVNVTQVTENCSIYYQIEIADLDLTFRAGRRTFEQRLDQGILTSGESAIITHEQLLDWIRLASQHNSFFITTSNSEQWVPSTLSDVAAMVETNVALNSYQRPRGQG